MALRVVPGVVRCGRVMRAVPLFVVIAFGFFVSCGLVERLEEPPSRLTTVPRDTPMPSRSVDDAANLWRSLALAAHRVAAIAADGRSLRIVPLAESAVVDEVSFAAPQGTVWVHAALGAEHGCALTEEGSLWCWGSNRWGQVSPQLDTETTIEVPERILPSPQQGHWRYVALGTAHSCGLLRAEGERRQKLLCWGREGPWLGTGGNEQDRAAEAFQAVNVDDKTDWVLVTVSQTQNCAIDSFGALWCWGQGPLMATGDGAAVDSERSIPSLVRPQSAGAQAEGEAWQGWSSVALGVDHACASRRRTEATNGGLLAHRDELYCWGRAGSRGLAPLYDGVPTSPTRPSPAVLDALDLPGDPWTILALGDAHTCASVGDESYLLPLVCWGWNRDGALGCASPEALGRESLMVRLDTRGEVVSFGTRSCLRHGGEVFCTANAVVGDDGPAVAGSPCGGSSLVALGE